jgi:GxxExxY protein
MDAFDFRERVNSGADDATEDLAKRVIGAAIEVHRELGPGMPERSYLLAMSRELTLRGIAHRLELEVPIIYKGQEVGFGRIDLLVEERLVVELKAVEQVTPVHKRQCLTYLRLLKLPLGLVINFNVELLRNGINRVINTK